jgi:methylase of polypeptide subunit release factors
MRVDKSEVTFHSLSGIDWSSRLFWWKGGLYRAIKREQVAFYEHLISTGIVQSLSRRKLLIDTEVTDLELDGYGLVLKHRTVPFVSYCYEWCGEMLKAAALSALELERELLNYGVALVDLQPQNILFLGTSPVWVDFGALVPASHWEDWSPYEVFSAHFTRPLKIMAAGHPRVARSLLRDGYPGIQEREVQAITKTAPTLMIRSAKAGAKAVAKKAIPLWLKPVVRRAMGRVSRPAPAGDPIRSVTRAIRDIETISLVQPTRAWSSSRSEATPSNFAPTPEWSEKHLSILRILSDKRPKSVLDTGADRGWYSQLAAQNGAQVVSVDFDEAALTQLFYNAVAANAPILPLIVDLRRMGPLTAMTNAPGLAPAERLRCDMVLALAPIHHLALNRSHFDLIINGLSAFARKWLVIECLEERGYDLNNLVSNLKKEFSQIEVVPCFAEHRRVLLLCDR